MGIPTKFILGVALGIGCAAGASAQDPNHVLGLSDATGGADSPFQVLATLDNEGGEISGWSYGVCSDPSLVTPISVASAGTATVKKGTRRTSRVRRSSPTVGPRES